MNRNKRLRRITLAPMPRFGARRRSLPFGFLAERPARGARLLTDGGDHDAGTPGECPTGGPGPDGTTDGPCETVRTAPPMPPAGIDWRPVTGPRSTPRLRNEGGYRCTTASTARAPVTVVRSASACN
jgi:hypothetical protein